MADARSGPRPARASRAQRNRQATESRQATEGAGQKEDAVKKIDMYVATENGGYAVAVVYKNHRKLAADYWENMDLAAESRDRLEIYAVRHGLSLLKEPCEVTVRMEALSDAEKNRCALELYRKAAEGHAVSFSPDRAGPEHDGNLRVCRRMAGEAREKGSRQYREYSERKILEDAHFAAGTLELLELGYEAPPIAARPGACAEEALGIIEGIRRFLYSLPGAEFPYRYFETFAVYERLVRERADRMRRNHGGAAAQARNRA